MLVSFFIFVCQASECVKQDVFGNGDLWQCGGAEKPVQSEIWLTDFDNSLVGVNVVLLHRWGDIWGELVDGSHDVVLTCQVSSFDAHSWGMLIQRRIFPLFFAIFKYTSMYSVCPALAGMIRTIMLDKHVWDPSRVTERHEGADTTKHAHELLMEAIGASDMQAARQIVVGIFSRRRSSAAGYPVRFVSLPMRGRAPA